MKKTKTKTEHAALPRALDLKIPGQRVTLRHKSLSDIHDDYAWHCDPELARMDASPVLTMSLSDYMLNYIDYLNEPATNSFRYAIDNLEGSHIGNCTYYNIDWLSRDAEVGIMIGDRRYQGNGYGTDALCTLVDFIFRNTRLRRLHLKTLDWNARAQRCFRKCGFTPYGHRREDGYDFILMELSREQWQQGKDKSGDRIEQPG